MQIHKIRQANQKTVQEEAEKGNSYCEKVLEEQNSANFHYGVNKIEYDEKIGYNHKFWRSQKNVCKQQRKTTETKY